MTEFISNLIICSGNKAAVLLLLTMAKKKKEKNTGKKVTEDKGAQRDSYLLHASVRVRE